MKYQMELDNELIVDSFCGGGGASEGIRMATGRDPDVAINHDPEAIAMHQANHPTTRHYCKSIYRVDPEDIVREYQKRVGLAWFSPDCTHHSKARGGKPKEKHIRDLAWVVVHFAERAVYQGQRPRMLFIENVEEFQNWGPLLEDGKPCPVQKGFEFKRWVKALQKLGYKVEWREVRASDFGAPTIRKRLFIIARCDGLPIVWPEAWCGKGKELPYRTAAECIDFNRPCPSIFLTKEEGKKVRAKRPLAPATLRRAAHGIKRYVLDAKEPFIINLTHQGAERVEPTGEPFKTITGANRGEKAIVQPFLAGCGGRMGQSEPRSVFSPYHTTTAKADTCLVIPFIAGAGGSEYSAKPVSAARPLGTVTKENHRAIIVPYLTEHANASNQRTFAADEPLRTQCAGVKGGHFALFEAQAAVLSSLYTPKSERDSRCHAPTDLMPTIMTDPRHALIAASMVQVGYGERTGQAPRALDPMKPLGTTVAGGGKHALAACFLAQHNNHREDEPNVGRSLADAVSTVTASGSQQGLVAASLIKLRGTCADGQPVSDPAATISAQGQHLACSAAFLTKYYGNEKDGVDLREPAHTATSKDRFALIDTDLAIPPLEDWQVARAHAVAALMREHGLWDDREFVTLDIIGVTYIIWDIGIRMLTERELFTAQGFRLDYIIDPMFNGKPMTKTAAVRMCGNSVSPPPACAIISHNVWPELMGIPKKRPARAMEFA